MRGEDLPRLTQNGSMDLCRYDGMVVGRTRSHDLAVNQRNTLGMHSAIVRAVKPAAPRLDESGNAA